MHRLRCGVIYTNAFADYLAAMGDSAAREQVLSLEYFRFATGPKKGTSWWRIDWLPKQRAEQQCCFAIGQTTVFLNSQTQRGLKDRCLDWRDGQVVVRS